jgi:hypothetical protein
LAELNIRVVAVIISRNPIEVAQSLADRQTRARPEQLWPLERGGLLWLRYVLAAERYSRGTLRSFCLYSSLLQNWREVAGRIAEDLSVSWPRLSVEAEHDINSFLSDRHRHRHEPDNIDTRQGVWSSWIAPIYDALQATAAGKAPDTTVFDTVGLAFESACASLGSVRLPETFIKRTTEPSFTLPADDQRSGKKALCLVGREFCRPADNGIAHLRSIVEAAAKADFRVTMVLSDASTVPGDATTDAGGLDIEFPGSSVTPIEPGFLRPTVEIFRHLRTRQFDVILFQDYEALGFASIIAKQTGLAFEKTVLGVVAFGSSRWRREIDGQFPSNPVPIATDYVEQKAVELSDVLILPTQQTAQWIEQAGWQTGKTLPLRKTAKASSPDENAWASVLLQTLTLEDWRVAYRNNEMRPNEVTVIIPHFEQPTLLDQALESLELQTDKNFSVLVVDDGSQDSGSLQYLATIEEQYRKLNLRLLRQDNRYLGAARNAGIRAATGDFVILLDADNFAFPDMVKVLRGAIGQAEADVVTCGIRHFHDTTERPRFDKDISGPDQFFSAGPMLLGAIHNCFGDASGIYRKAVFDKVGYFHELRGVTFEDWHMHLRIVAAGFRLLSLPEPLVWYRVRPNSMLRTTRRFDNARVIASAINELPCSMLEPLADYLMGSEAELVRLYGEIARLTRQSS